MGYRNHGYVLALVAPFMASQNLVNISSGSGLLHVDTKPLPEPILTNPQWSLWYSPALQWRHNKHDGVSNQQPNDCLLNRLFGCRWRKTQKLCVTSLCEGNSPVADEFPTQRASNAEMLPFDDVTMDGNFNGNTCRGECYKESTFDMSLQINDSI